MNLQPFEWVPRAASNALRRSSTHPSTAVRQRVIDRPAKDCAFAKPMAISAVQLVP